MTPRFLHSGPFVSTIFSVRSGSSTEVIVELQHDGVGEVL